MNRRVNLILRQDIREVSPLLILVVLLLIPVVIFAVQNAQMVSITFLSWSLSLNMAIVVLGSLLIGLLVGTVWTWLKGAKVRGQVRQLTKALEASTRQVKQLEQALEEQRDKAERLEAELRAMEIAMEAHRTERDTL
jgi:putative membrane protein